MKLLMVTPYFYPKVGGLENYAYNIAKGLKKDYGWDVVIITSNHEKRIYSQDMVEGMKVYRLPIFFKISNTPIHPLWYFTIKKIIKNEKPDIINAHAPVPYLADIAALACGDIPFYLTYHSGSMKKNKMFFDMIILMYEKLVLPHTIRKARKIIATSEFVKNSILNTFKDKVVTITPGVDTNIFRPSRKKNTSENIILLIGNQSFLYPLKGLFVLTKALENYPYLKIKVIGEKGISTNSKVEYLGYKNTKELVTEIQKSSIVVLPSLMEESFGMVLIEAMACRKPVVGSNIGGIAEVINNNIYSPNSGLQLMEGFGNFQ